MLTLSLGQFNFRPTPQNQPQKLKPSNSSVQLWVDAFNFLCRNQLMEFLITLDALRREVFSQLVIAGKMLAPDNLDNYYTTIYDSFEIKDNNIERFISPSQYRKYLNIASYVIEKANVQFIEIYQAEISRERSIHLLKSIMYAKSITYFLPYVGRFKIPHEKISHRLAKQVDHFIDRELEIVTDDPLTEAALNDVLSDLQQLATHLHTKYQACFFKRFQRGLLSKWTDINTLRGSLQLAHYTTQGSQQEEKSTDGLSSRAVNTVLKQAENTHLGQHRRWLSNKLAFFTGQQPDTKQRLQSIRRRLYDNESERLKAQLLNA